MNPVYRQILIPEGKSFSVRHYGTFVPWHFHPEFELNLILKSAGMRFVGDSIEPFREGDLVLLGPNLPHMWELSAWKPFAVRRSHAITVHFHTHGFLGDLLNHAEFKSVKALLENASHGIRFQGSTQKKARQLLEESVHVPEERQTLKWIEVLDLLARSAEAIPLSTREYNPRVKPADIGRINKAMEYVRNHLGEPICQRELAKHLNMSPEGFSRFFKRKTGKRFVDFTNEMRLAKACDLLATTEFSVTRISYECGFSSLSFFNQRFKQVKGLTPGQYRAHLQTG